MKRLAYCLIGFGCIWIVGLTTLSEKPLTRDTRDFALVVGLVCSSVAGWLLSGTGIPKEGTGGRLLMTLGFAVVGTVISFCLFIGSLIFRAWLFPGSPLTGINDK